MKKILNIIFLTVFVLGQTVAYAADTTHFLNTDCANNGDGTLASPCAASPGAAGPWKTCAQMVTGEVAAQPNLTTRGGNLIINAVGAAVDGQCAVNGFTGQDSTHLFRLVGNRTLTTWDTASYRISSSANGATLAALDPYIEFDKLQVENTGTGTGGYIAIDYTNAGGGLYGKVTNSVVRGADCNEGGGGFCIGINLNPEANNSICIVSNNFVYGPVSGNVALRCSGNAGTGETIVAYANTIWGGNKGLSTHGGSSADAQYIKDNVIDATVTAYSLDESSAHTTTVTANNISDDTTSPDVAFRSKTCSFTNTSTGTEDFSLQSGDTNCKNTGTSLTTDPDAKLNVTIDIVGTSRPQGVAVDIGAHELISAGALVSSLTTLKVTGTH